MAFAIAAGNAAWRKMSACRAARCSAARRAASCASCGGGPDADVDRRLSAAAPDAPRRGGFDPLRAFGSVAGCGGGLVSRVCADATFFFRLIGNLLSEKPRDSKS